MYHNCGEIENFSTCGEMSEISTWQMWTKIVEKNDKYEVCPWLSLICTSFQWLGRLLLCSSCTWRSFAICHLQSTGNKQQSDDIWGIMTNCRFGFNTPGRKGRGLILESQYFSLWGEPLHHWPGGENDFFRKCELNCRRCVHIGQGQLGNITKLNINKSMHCSLPNATNPNVWH